MERTPYFYLFFVTQLILDVVFYFVCKWVWTLNIYLDSFCDNIMMDTICPIYFILTGILIYIYSYYHTRDFKRMYLTPSPISLLSNEVYNTSTRKNNGLYIWNIHSISLSRGFIYFGLVLYYHSSFGLAVLGGYIVVSFIACIVIEFQIILPRLMLMEYDLVFMRCRFGTNKKTERAYLD
ncbi:Uncharacterized protein QTN25_003757 [Entamoeba marina]